MENVTNKQQRWGYCRSGSDPIDVCIGTILKILL